MDKILILYYSGVGNTKRVAEIIARNISSQYIVDIYSIEKLPGNFDLKKYKAVSIGFPTIHCSPAKPIVTFLKNITKLESAIPIYLFTTCGMYSANSLRIFSKMCMVKNMTPIINKSYRCSATDGMLLVPFIKFLCLDEKNLHKKVEKDCFEFMKLLKEPLRINIPKTKLYSILNYPNKVLGQRLPFKIYIHKEKCVGCGKCISNCPVQAYKIDDNKFPIIDKSKCISCYRCIHHCPKRALSLSKKKTPKKTLFSNDFNLFN